MRVIQLIRRLRDEFTAMPGLRLTAAQTERLGDVEASTAASALHALVSAGFLTALPDGSYGRTDVAPTARTVPPIGPRAQLMHSPWRRLLCVVESGNESALSASGRAALRYATTLAVTHRARITALQVIPEPASTAALSAATSELRRHLSSEPFRDLIDVQVATGAPDEEVARAATDVSADLIVIGRSRHPRASLSRLSDTLHQAPCPVLIVHPSGRAAVA